MSRWENFTAEQKADIERMTNWQRNQWARAGYPDDTAKYAGMVHWSFARRLGAVAEAVLNR